MDEDEGWAEPPIEENQEMGDKHSSSEVEHTIERGNSKVQGSGPLSKITCIDL